MKAARYAKGLNKGIFWLTSLALLLALVLPSDGTGIVQASPGTETLRPNDAGTYQEEWSMFGSPPSHWQGTSDQSDATGVQVTGSTTLKETENLADTSQTGTINSVTAYMRAKIVEGGGAVEKAKIGWRTYSTDYESAATNIDRAAFTDYSEGRTTNPNTGQAWTWTEVNALEIGSRASTLAAAETIQVSEYWVDVDYTPFSTAISIVGKEADTAVGTITFSEGAPDATVSDPYNDVDGDTDKQVLHASTSEPVVRLKNTSAGTLTVWLEITTWGNGVAVSEDYELVDTGTTTVAVVDDVLSADGNAASVNTGVTIAAAAYKALYLELVLSSLAGKSGSSTLTILGEA